MDRQTVTTERQITRETLEDRYTGAMLTRTDLAQEAAMVEMEYSIAGAIGHARQRLADLDSPPDTFENEPVGGVITDPEEIEAIEAELFLTVYNAMRLARRRVLGLEPELVASPKALALLRRSRAGVGR